jgi:hypothetical protein
MADHIQRMEREAVIIAIGRGQMPTPICKGWEKIKADHGLPEPVPVDRVLSTVTLPTNWTCQININDPYRRSVDILDSNSLKRGHFFLKKTPYDYYGYTSFD